MSAGFKKQRATRIPLQLQEKVQQFFDNLTHSDINAPVNIDLLTTRNTFVIRLIIVKKGESTKILLDASQINSMIDETKWSGLI